MNTIQDQDISKCPFASLLQPRPALKDRPEKTPPSSPSPRRPKEIPGPPGLPFIGSYFDFLKDPLTFFTRLRRDYGDVVHFKMAAQDYYVLNHPRDIQNFLVRYHDKIKKAGVMVKAKNVLGDGIFTAEGGEHKRQRRLVQPAFSAACLGEYGKIMSGTILKRSRNWSDGQTINITKEMNQLALDIAGQTLFGEDLFENSGELNRAVNHIMEYFNPRSLLLSRMWPNNPFPKTQRFKAALTLIDDVVKNMIVRNENHHKTDNNFLSMLIRSIDQDQGLNVNSRKEIRDQVMTMLMAGHESTATALNWTWMLIAQHPTVEQKMNQEIINVFGDSRPDSDALHQLVYMEMIIKESMRLFPPAWALKRRLMKDLRVGAVVIPAGSIVGVSQFVTHRDSRFFKNPLMFDPMRWREEEAVQRPLYSYFPFGGGPRSCIGAGFAMMEIKLVLATLRQQWKFELIPGQQIEFKPLITLRSKNPIFMKVTKIRKKIRSLPSRVRVEDD